MKKIKFNLGWTFLLGVSGGIAPFFFNLVEVNFNLFKVDSHHYFLFIVAAVCFFLAYQIAKHMNIPKKTDSFYFTVLVIYFLIFITISMVVTLLYAIL